MSLATLEIATGRVFGAAEHPPPLPEPTDATPLQALEQAILPALVRPPCLVSFSGGRDSSAVLAVATALARREGLALPIPATNVITGASGAEETEWQTQLVEVLGLADWLRIEHTDELDVIGPYAQRVLRRHGLLLPFNVHFHLPLLEAAGQGSLLSGIAGGELISAARRLRLDGLRTRTVRPEVRDLVRIAFAFAPTPVRRTVIRRREPVTLPWLRQEGRRVASALDSHDQAAEPRPLRDRMAWWRSLRYIEVGTSAVDRVARDLQVAVTHPLLSPRFWASAAATAPLGFASRTDGMRRLFTGFLPEQLIARKTKAHFDEAFWTRRAREFARQCSAPEGVSAQWVDPTALSQHWTQNRPLAQSFTLLQAAWLGSERRALERTERPCPAFTS